MVSPRRLLEIKSCLAESEDEIQFPVPELRQAVHDLLLEMQKADTAKLMLKKRMSSMSKSLKKLADQIGG